MSRGLRAWGPPLLWAAAIFFASSRPTLPVSLNHGRDKVVHFLVYAVLGVLLARARPGAGAFPWLAVLLGLAYGASDEIHQAFVPGRSSDVVDWVADSLGVLTGAWVHHRWRSRRARGAVSSTLAESVRP